MCGKYFLQMLHFILHWQKCCIFSKLIAIKLLVSNTCIYNFTNKLYINIFFWCSNDNVLLVYLDYFMKEMGPFSEIFANLESMNRAVSNALVESAKVCTLNYLT